MPILDIKETKTEVNNKLNMSSKNKYSAQSKENEELKSYIEESKIKQDSD